MSARRAVTRARRGRTECGPLPRARHRQPKKTIAPANNASQGRPPLSSRRIGVHGLPVRPIIKAEIKAQNLAGGTTAAPSHSLQEHSRHLRRLLGLSDNGGHSRTTRASIKFIGGINNICSRGRRFHHHCLFERVDRRSGSDPNRGYGVSY